MEWALFDRPICILLLPPLTWEGTRQAGRRAGSFIKPTGHPRLQPLSSRSLNEMTEPPLVAFHSAGEMKRQDVAPLMPPRKTKRPLALPPSRL